ncbi:glycosyltransferase family 25 protein [Pararhodobacter zhoushanensis]|uniref:glycosyltransferase family 25 protein n=1 Tax=Pararhodobacter zhoushanensis TaxID=2479545 RepID=UPI0013DE8126|nr:glycosyltransferase family 25 protein [Pararhodobacter zhoushanensis]
MPTPPVYVINLDGSADRLASASAQLHAAGLTFERVPAFDGRGLTVAEFPDYDAARARAYMGRPLRGGEIGCYLSHLRAARRVAESGALVGIVLEDDVQLSPDFASVFPQLLDWLAAQPRDWDLINLGANKHRIYTVLDQITGRDGSYQITRAHYFPMMASALLWSREGAQAFVDGHDQIFAPVDNYFRHWLTRSDRGLAVWPPLTATTGVVSDIMPNAKRSAEDRHTFYGLIKQRRLLVNKLLALRHKRALARR